MKRNSPGCTCCKPHIFGNQHLWGIGLILAGHSGVEPDLEIGVAGSHLDRGGFAYSQVRGDDLPDWVIIVNSWGTISHVEIDGAGPMGGALTENMGFNHEFAGLLMPTESLGGGGGGGFF